MSASTNSNASNRRGGRRSRAYRALAALAAAPLLLNLQCGDEATRAFKQAAFPQLEAGLKAALDGLVTGVFTINSDSSTNSASTSTNSSGG